MASCPKIQTEPESSNPGGVLEICGDQPTWHGPSKLLIDGVVSKNANELKTGAPGRR